MKTTPETNNNNPTTTKEDYFPFPARLTAETRKIIENIAENENCSMNDAILNCILRWEKYPKSWKEIHNQLQSAEIEITALQLQMEQSIRNEEDILRNLERPKSLQNNISKT
jgi:hypothetical protein